MFNNKIFNKKFIKRKKNINILINNKKRLILFLKIVFRIKLREKNLKLLILIIIEIILLKILFYKTNITFINFNFYNYN